MKVLVDTSIWSLALRRRSGRTSPHVGELRQLIADRRVQIIGPIRQELLSGIRDDVQFKRLAGYLEAFPDVPIRTEDYVDAASLFNLCHSKGVQGSNTDFLICAIALRNGFVIYTSDRDFKLFAAHIPIVLYQGGDS